MSHIYVHVPFCARRCSYCDFAIAVRRTVPGTEFVNAIRAERELRMRRGDWLDDPVETLYFGGGTPSRLPPEDIATLVTLLAPRQTGAGAEITLEANPEDITPGYARGLRAAGINRVSLGAQSFAAPVLAWMHRTHAADSTARAIDALRAAGVQNVSLDLIFGLPEEIAGHFAADLERAIELAPEHLSVYGLSVEDRTPLARWISRGVTTVPVEDRYATEFLLAHERLETAGYEHYEVSNYARPGLRSRHNSAYWVERPYIGLGPAAHSYRSGERSWNDEAWSSYVVTLQRGEDPTVEKERLSAEQQQTERWYLGLRTRSGIPVNQWRRDPDRDARWLNAGWLIRDGDRYRLSPEGWLRLDEIVAVLTTSALGG